MDVNLSRYTLSLVEENRKLKAELAEARAEIKNLSGGVKFEDPVEKLHYDHWVDKTLKKKV